MLSWPGVSVPGTGQHLGAGESTCCPDSLDVGANCAERSQGCPSVLSVLAAPPVAPLEARGLLGAKHQRVRERAPHHVVGDGDVHLDDLGRDACLVAGLVRLDEVGR